MVIHNIHTYRQTYRQTDRQTDIYIYVLCPIAGGGRLKRGVYNKLQNSRVKVGVISKSGVRPWVIPWVLFNLLGVVKMV